jgi:predicted ester cyclase/quercetin dioxygenase-like cupin family protein
MKNAFYSILILATSIFFCSCNSNNQKADLEANRELVRKYHQVWSDGQVANLDKFMSPDFVCHFINGLEWKGIEGAKNSISSHKISFPDWKEEIVDIIAEGDKVVTRYKSTGTHKGIFNGLDSTGIKVTIFETSIYRIANGKLVEQWGFPDALSLDRQLKASIDTLKSGKSAKLNIDGLKASPANFKLLLENEHVRVLEYTLKAGEKDTPHTHPAKSSYVVSGGKIKVFLENGETLLFDEKANTANWSNYIGKHSVENIGNTTMKIILTEIKAVK